MHYLESPAPPLFPPICPCTLRAHRKSRACLSMPPHEREGLTRPALKYFPRPGPPTRHATYSPARRLCVVRCLPSPVLLPPSLRVPRPPSLPAFFPAHPSRSPKKQGLLIDASP